MGRSCRCIARQNPRSVGKTGALTFRARRFSSLLETTGTHIAPPPAHTGALIVKKCILRSLDDQLGSAFVKWWWDVVEDGRKLDSLLVSNINGIRPFPPLAFAMTVFSV